MGDVLDPRRAFHPRTFFFGPQGVRCAKPKKTVPSRRIYRLMETIFPLFVRIFFKRSQSNHTIIGIFSLK
jgi:hypothetical protein